MLFETDPYKIYLKGDLFFLLCWPVGVYFHYNGYKDDMDDGSPGKSACQPFSDTEDNPMPDPTGHRIFYAGRMPDGRAAGLYSTLSR
jgi:hypothetical protein